MRFVIEWREVVGRGREIKELREKMGMNRREFSDYYGIPYRTVQDWEAEDIEEILKKKEAWISKHIEKTKETKERFEAEPTEKLTREKVIALAEEALKVIPERVEYFAKVIGVTYGKITIRNQKTRWGSCSSKENLNFNCLLMLAPPEVLDYVVVHELCHRKQMNHSKAFWLEVEKVLPDYKEARKWLKEEGSQMITLFL